MAEEVQKIETQQKQQQPEVAEVVAVTDVVPNSDKTTPPTQPQPQPQPETEVKETMKPIVETDEVSKNGIDDEKVVVTDNESSTCFKEESNKIADLLDLEKNALEELKKLVQEALIKHEFCTKTPTPPPTTTTMEEKDKTPEVKKQKDAVLSTEDKTPEEDLKEKEEKVETLETTIITNVVDDDGAKTVEAIEETIVAVSSTATTTQQDHNSTPTKESVTVTNVITPSDNDQEAKDVNQSETLTTIPPEEVFIYGIRLLADERSDVILLKFLRARDFKVKEAFTMLKNTINWRKEFKIDELMEQDLDCGNDLGRVVFMHGFDKEGHPVCYNVYGEFQNKELYQKTFSDEEKRQKFLRWRIQFLEKSIRKLDFRTGGVSTIVQVNDLKNSPGPAKRELRQATKQALQLLQDNYPEFVARQVFINVPWWYLAVNKMISPFLTQRTKSKFIVAGPSKSAETLLRFITAEQLPVKYGGLMSKDGEFDTADTVTEITVKPAAKHTVEFPVTEACLITWEFRVVGWDVSYGAEFVPSAEESYTVIIQKSRKVSASEAQGVVCNSFKVSEPGKVVITVDNPTSKKKKLLYRLKIKSASD